jgi:hypothetical protein
MRGPNPPRRARTAAARAFLFGFLGWLLAGTAAQAQVTNFDGLAAPIVRINLKQGDVTIRTWDRPTVSVDGDASLLVERHSWPQSGEPYAVPVALVQAKTPDGPVSLPSESFVVSTIPAGPRQVILVRSPLMEPAGGSAFGVTVTVPSGSVFVFAHTNNGILDVRDYRGGTLFATTVRGRVVLDNVGGAVFAQSTRGSVAVVDSSLDRVRARSLTGNVTFERCRARQIEATSVNGSIVYDGGTFAPGLARFESTRGDVAVGAAGDAEIGAHAAGGGRVYTNFDRGAHIDGRDGQTNAVIGAGGPVVNATSQGGNVYLYDGSLRTRGQMSPEWDAPLGALQHPAEGAAHPSVRPQGTGPQRKYGRPRRNGFRQE